MRQGGYTIFMRSATNFYKHISFILNIDFNVKFFPTQITKQNKGNNMK